MPGIVAITVLLLIGAKGEVSDLLRRLNPLRSSPKLLLVAMLIPALVLFVAACANLIAGGSDMHLPKISFWIWSVLVNLPFAPLWEELGWRGFLLTRLLLARRSFAASLIVGLIWGPW